MNTRVKIAVVGASGYTGSELLRLLLLHPNAELRAVTSRQYAGQSLAEIFPRYRALDGAELSFIAPDADAIAATGAEVAFLALPHGVAAEYAADLLERGLKVIDLSADFRINDPAVYEDFYGNAHPDTELLKEAVYGFPEVRADEIRKARLVAAPGCYPTSISLPLLPVVASGKVDIQSVVTCSMSGVSGAGKTGNVMFSFCEANESVRAYSVPRHRHLSEIEQELSIAAGEKVVMSFTPHLVPTHNGICTTSSVKWTGGGSRDEVCAEITKLMEQAYGEQYFVRLLGAGKAADTKNVTRTNFLDIGWDYDERTGRLMLLSAEDNLCKGAGGQAVQCFNLMFDLEASAGLLLA